MEANLVSSYECIPRIKSSRRAPTLLVQPYLAELAARHPCPLLRPSFWDILTLILDKLTPREVFQTLWCTGDQTMRHVLSHNVWHSFRTTIVLDTVRDTNWPNILNLLHCLRELHIEVHYARAYSWWSCLFNSKISDFETLSQNSNLHTIRYNEQDVSGSSTDYDDYGNACEENWVAFDEFNFGQRFPKLTTLEWRNQAAPLSLTNVQTLPPTLTELQVDELDDSVPWSALPADLQTLDAGYLQWKIPRITLGMPPITSLRALIREGSALIDVQNIENLSSSLVSLDLHFETTPNFKCRNNWTLYLPRQLRHFTVSGLYGAENFGDLPPMLETFNVGHVWECDAQNIARLPRSLLKLKMFIVGGAYYAIKIVFHDDAFAALPRHLKSLDLVVEHTCTEESLMSLLPSTLTELRLTDHMYLTTYSISNCTLTKVVKPPKPSRLDIVKVVENE